jgi:hypothetical protein
MDLRKELTRQSLLLEFISECVSLQNVPDLAKLVTARLHRICDYDSKPVRGGGQASHISAIEQPEVFAQLVEDFLRDL